MMNKMNAFHKDLIHLGGLSPIKYITCVNPQVPVILTEC